MAIFGGQKKGNLAVGSCQRVIAMVDFREGLDKGRCPMAAASCNGVHLVSIISPEVMTGPKVEQLLDYPEISGHRSN